MLSAVWLVVAVVVAVVLSMWVTFTLTRLDRLHARVDAAQAALDAQLVRRAAALQHLAERPDSGVPDARRPYYDKVAQDALATPAAGTAREPIENAIGRAVAELSQLPLPVEFAAELHEAAARVRIARRFYNDAVRDTRALRERRLPRVFHMAGHRDMPEFFDIDDTLPPSPLPQALPPSPLPQALPPSPLPQALPPSPLPQPTAAAEHDRS